MDNKAEDFVECLLYDLFDCFVQATQLDLGLPEIYEPKRCMPEDLYYSLLNFSDVFIKELMSNIQKLPVLLCWSEDLFKRFTNSVCLKLIKNVDPEVDFLKVMAFLMVIIAMSFLKRCYRWIDEIPKILETLLKERIQTKFYEENGFDAISLQCERLRKNDDWYKSAVEEIQTCIKDSFETELAATKPPLFDDLFEERTKIEISDAEFHEKFLSSNGKNNCPLCATNCISILRAFFVPRIIYKPWRKQMQ